jgi:hypothetical protein
MYTRNNKAREERVRQMREADLVSARFPDVSRIVVKMQYKHPKTPSMLRTLNYRPGSQAFFKMSCLGEGCVDGGLDMTRIISKMIRGHEKSVQGDIRCQNRDPAAIHANIAYKVSITYA